jgi:hypothetical protein
VPSAIAPDPAQGPVIPAAASLQQSRRRHVTRDARLDDLQARPRSRSIELNTGGVELNEQPELTSMFFPVSDWFAAFALTVAVELPIAAYLLRRAEPALLRRVSLIVLANLATHPVVWFVITQLLLIGTPGYTLVAETWAIAAEAVFYGVMVRGLPARRAIAVAVAANAASFLTGRLIGSLSPDWFR